MQQQAANWNHRKPQALSIIRHSTHRITSLPYSCCCIIDESPPVSGPWAVYQALTKVSKHDSSSMSCPWPVHTQLSLWSIINCIVTISRRQIDENTYNMYHMTRCYSQKHRTGIKLSTSCSASASVLFVLVQERQYS